MRFLAICVLVSANFAQTQDTSSERSRLPLIFDFELGAQVDGTPVGWQGGPNGTFIAVAGRSGRLWTLHEFLAITGKTDVHPTSDVDVQRQAIRSSVGLVPGCWSSPFARIRYMDTFMQAAVAQAQVSAGEGGIPIGSVLVHNGRILGRGHNRRVQKGSVILHGEMDALEHAGRQRAQVYRESVLYTTLSPCAMCSGAILLYGIPRIIVGENLSFRGEEDLLRSRGVQIEILQDPVCIQLMRDFLIAQPELWREDIGA